MGDDAIGGGDFVEDAIDNLEKSQSGYMMIAAFPGRQKAWYAAGGVVTQEQLDWMVVEFEKLVADVRGKIAEGGGM